MKRKRTTQSLEESLLTAKDSVKKTPSARKKTGRGSTALKEDTPTVRKRTARSSTTTKIPLKKSIIPKIRAEESVRPTIKTKVLEGQQTSGAILTVPKPIKNYQDLLLNQKLKNFRNYLQQGYKLTFYSPDPDTENFLLSIHPDLNTDTFLKVLFILEKQYRDYMHKCRSLKIKVDSLREENQRLERLDQSVRKGNIREALRKMKRLHFSIENLKRKYNQKRQTANQVDVVGKFLGEGGSARIFRGKEQDQALKISKDFFSSYIEELPEEMKSLYYQTGILPDEVVQDLYKGQQKINPNLEMAHEYLVYSHAKKAQVLTNSFLPLKHLSKEGNVIVMELLKKPDWMTLRNYLDDHMNDIEENVLRGITTMLCNLVYTVLKLHDTGIVHLDLKPDNIFVNPSTGGVLVFDFGVSAVFCKKKGKWKKCLMPPADFMGSPAYLPEGKRVPDDMNNLNDEGLFKWLKKRDIYALGVTIFESLFGHFPDEPPVDERLREKRERILKKILPRGACEPVREYKSMLETDQNKRKITWKWYEILNPMLQDEDNLWKNLGVAFSLKTAAKKRLQNIISKLSGKNRDQMPTLSQFLSEAQKDPLKKKLLLEQIVKIKRSS